MVIGYWALGIVASGGSAIRENRVYNSGPAHQPNKTEGKKNKFDGAEFDEQFIDRIGKVKNEEMRVYLQTLPEEARKAIEQANNAAVAKWIVQDYMEWLTSGGGY